MTDTEHYRIFLRLLTAFAINRYRDHDNGGTTLYYNIENRHCSIRVIELNITTAEMGIPVFQISTFSNISIMDISTVLDDDSTRITVATRGEHDLNDHDVSRKVVEEFPKMLMGIFEQFLFVERNKDACRH